MDFVLPIIYIYIDIGTNRINSQSDSNWLFNPQKITKMAVSQNPISQVGGVGFLVNDTWVKWGFEIW